MCAVTIRRDNRISSDPFLECSDPPEPSKKPAKTWHDHSLSFTRIEFINCCCKNTFPNFVLVLMRQHSPALSPRFCMTQGLFCALFHSSIFFPLCSLQSLSLVFPYVSCPHWPSPFLLFFKFYFLLILILWSLYGAEGWQPKLGFSKRVWQPRLPLCVCRCQLWAAAVVVDKMLCPLALSEKTETFPSSWLFDTCCPNDAIHLRPVITLCDLKVLWFP